MSAMRMCAASRPVSILPDNSSVWPGFQLATSAGVSVSRSTRLLVSVLATHCTLGQLASEGASSLATPEPSSTKCAWRVAAQFGMMAIGLLAACVGAARIFTSSTVARPPRPCAPMPSALTFSYSSTRNASIQSRGPRAMMSWISIDSISDSFAISMAFSAVPPMPMPSIPGGHQPAPMVGTVLSTQSTMESEGFSMANLALFSEPPPLAATWNSTVLPGTIS